MSEPAGRSVRLYSTCPKNTHSTTAEYAQQVRDVARWSEDAGCHGILVYTDNSMLDPWLVAQQVIEATERIRPLVAVQPVYAHPYSVAKNVASLAFLHDRAVDLNWLAGGFLNDLSALGDRTPHDDRYARTAAYADLVARLVRGERVTVEDAWHNVENLALTPAVPDHLQPGHLISGSSAAGIAAARQLGATAVRYPKPVADEAQDPTAGQTADTGVRLGVIARETAEQAWEVARGRFPRDRRGQVQHQLAMKVSDSEWHRQLSLLEAEEDLQNPYWLGAFNNGQTFCPYLVGSYDRVADEVARYLTLGFQTFVLDVPPDAEELFHIGVAFQRAMAVA